MAKIQDFLDSKRIDEQIEDAYKSGHHFEWISLTSTILEQTLKAFLHTSLVSEFEAIEMDKALVDYINSMSFRTAVMTCYIKGILPKALFEKITEFREKRNLILHRLILKNERLKSVNLEKYCKLSKECVKELIKQWFTHTSIQMIPMDKKLEILKKAKEDGIL